MGEDVAMLRPKRFEHVGIVVADLDRTLRFYVEGLGFELLHRRGVGRGSSAALKVGGAEINIFCNPDPAPAATSERQSIDHICLSVESVAMDDLVQELREARIEVASGPVARSDGTAVFVHDPDGVRVELLVKHAAAATDENGSATEILREHTS